MGLNSSIGSITPVTQPAAYYYTAKPGEITMSVNLWGQALRPGRYEVASNTNIVQLLSFAGGPQPTANMEEVKIVRIEKENDKDVLKEIVVDLENIKTADPIILKPGDTIIIKPTFWSEVKDAFGAISVAATVTIAISQLINVTKK